MKCLNIFSVLRHFVKLYRLFIYESNLGMLEINSENIFQKRSINMSVGSFEKKKKKKEKPSYRKFHRNGVYHLRKSQYLKCRILAFKSFCEIRMFCYLYNSKRGFTVKEATLCMDVNISVRPSYDVS